MDQLKKHSIVAINLSKTILYSLEYKLLLNLSKAFDKYVTPPKIEDDKKLIKHLEKKVIEIHQQDAQNIIDNFYPAEVLLPKNFIGHIKHLPNLVWDSFKISRRRKLNLKSDLPIQSANIPDYLQRNYHFQTDGYFSDTSASLYEHQVEVLFSGTAAPMRRMLIPLIKNRLPNKDAQINILELGAGVGSATIDFAKSFPNAHFFVTDVSFPYLKLAEKRIADLGLSNQFTFYISSAEDLSFADESFDLVYSIFLFHELPRQVRAKVLSESKRVLKKDGILAWCDSIQKDDDAKLNTVLENFPIDYHEPFYKDYTLWDAKKELEQLNFKNISSSIQLLSKYYIANK